MPRPKTKHQAELFEQQTIVRPLRFKRPGKDNPWPIGRWVIKASHRYVHSLKLDPIAKYILEEHLASRDVVSRLDFYFYNAETLKILKCPSFEETIELPEEAVVV